MTIRPFTDGGWALCYSLGTKMVVSSAMQNAFFIVLSCLTFGATEIYVILMSRFVPSK